MTLEKLSDEQFEILKKAVNRKQAVLSRDEARSFLKEGLLRFYQRRGRKSEYRPTNAGIRAYNNYRLELN